MIRYIVYDHSPFKEKIWFLFMIVVLTTNIARKGSLLEGGLDHM